MARHLESEAASFANLAGANEERSREVREAIHEAARRILPPRDRELIPRDRWAATVFGWLLDNYRLVGLNSAPCRRVVNKHMAEWIPPTGGHSWGVKNGVKFDHREG
jgi:hypothetical protein